MSDGFVRGGFELLLSTTKQALLTYLESLFYYNSLVESSGSDFFSSKSLSFSSVAP